MNGKVTEKNVARVMETYKPLLLQNIIVTEQFIDNMRKPSTARNHDQRCAGRSASYSLETESKTPVEFFSVGHEPSRLKAHVLPFPK